MRAGSPVEIEVSRVLQTDRAWCAYALGDLCPPWSRHAEWLRSDRSVVLVYQGLRPPVLFAHGEPAELRQLFSELESGEYWFTLRATEFSLLAPRLVPESQKSMWRMRLIPDDFTPPAEVAAFSPLSLEDLELLEQLYGNDPMRPDAFLPDQLEHGVYFGVRDQERLVSASGTHVLCDTYGVAAVGNVFTDPAHRRRGYAEQTSAGVIGELIDRGIQTIVLNVAMDNQPAIELYRKLGFMPYCGFYEGVGRLD